LVAWNRKCFRVGDAKREKKEYGTSAIEPEVHSTTVEKKKNQSSSLCKQKGGGEEARKGKSIPRLPVGGAEKVNQEAVKGKKVMGDRREGKDKEVFKKKKSGEELL